MEEIIKTNGKTDYNLTTNWSFRKIRIQKRGRRMVLMAIFEDIMAVYFPELMKDTNPQCRKPQKIN